MSPRLAYKAHINFIAYLVSKLILCLNFSLFFFIPFVEDHGRPFYKAVADVDEETYDRVQSLYHPDALDFSKKRRNAPPKKRTITKSRASKGTK